jgi:hypothetical protein
MRTSAHLAAACCFVVGCRTQPPVAESRPDVSAASAWHSICIKVTGDVKSPGEIVVHSAGTFSLRDAILRAGHCKYLSEKMTATIIRNGLMHQGPENKRETYSLLDESGRPIFPEIPVYDGDLVEVSCTGKVHPAYKPGLFCLKGRGRPSRK